LSGIERRGGCKKNGRQWIIYLQRGRAKGRYGPHRGTGKKKKGGKNKKHMKLKINGEVDVPSFLHSKITWGGK